MSGLEINSPKGAKTASLALLDKFKIQAGIIVTLGEMGVCFTDKVKTFHQKCQKVNVVDTTVNLFFHDRIRVRYINYKKITKKGAGDAFVGSFAHYLNKYGKNNIEKAIELACEYATYTTTQHGTQASYPNISQLDAKFKD